MGSSQLFGLAMLAYILASAAYLGGLLFKTQKFWLAGRILCVCGVMLHLLATLLRWYASHQVGMGHAPLTNMYESLVFFALSVALINLFFEHRFRLHTLGAFVMPVAAVSMAYASFSDRVDASIKPLLPALQSNWLIGHVVTCFIGYGAFAVAAGLGAMYLLKNRAASPNAADRQNALVQELDDLDEFVHKTIIFGFLWLTAGIISGAVWANEAWDTYWNWDPKETWSLITWFFYAFTLHARFTGGKSGCFLAWMALFGFVAVLFTYFGVNFLLSGLHSYGSA